MDCKNGIPYEIEGYISKIIENEGYLSFDINSKLITTNGGNYLSELYEVDIKGKTKDGNKETNLFIKHTPPLDMSDFLKINDVFKNEAFFYNEIAKQYNDLQDKASIPYEERYTIARSYFCNETTIIMDNASRQGYDILDRRTLAPLTFDTVCIKQLAKFHALSFALERKKSKFYENNIKTLKNPMRFDENWNKLFGNMAKLALDVFDEETKSKLEEAIPKLLDNMRRYCTENDSVICCLCHGDYRPNNILRLETNGQTTHAIPVDYQTAYYGCPATDLLYFIAFTSDRKVRQNHLEFFKSLYHDTLASFLKYFDMDAEEVYPRKEFEKTFEDRLDYALLISLIGIPILFVPEDDAPTLQDFYHDKVTIEPGYEGRVKDLVDLFDVMIRL